MTYLKLKFDLFKKVGNILLYYCKIPIFCFYNFFKKNYKKIHCEIIMLFNNILNIKFLFSNKKMCFICKKKINKNYFIENNILKFINYKRKELFWVVSSDR